MKSALTGQGVNCAVSYLHVMFLHLRYRPNVGATARGRGLVVEDCLDRTPATQAILVKALDQKKFQSLRGRKISISLETIVSLGVMHAYIVAVSHPAKLIGLAGVES
jgi:hypothetical protein